MFRNLLKFTASRPNLSLRCYTDAQTVIKNDGISINTTTIDKGEISNFKKLVGTWWDEEGEMKPLHSMNSLRVPFVRDGLKNNGKLDSDSVNSSTPLKNLNILDVGCGGGILSEPLARLGATVTGVDACQDLIECATLHAKETEDLSDKITYVYGSVEDLIPAYNQKFDAVVSSECLEHIVAKDAFLKSCIDVLKPGGSLFLTTINKTTLSWLLGIVASEYILNIVPKGTHDWQKFVSPEEILKTLEQNRCKTRIIHGLTYNIFTNKWFWISNTSINFALHAVKGA